MLLRVDCVLLLCHGPSGIMERASGYHSGVFESRLNPELFRGSNFTLQIANNRNINSYLLMIFIGEVCSDITKHVHMNL